MPLISDFRQFLESKGLYFSPQFLDSFILSAKTRPLIILGGPSGTGKSALPRALSEFLGTDATSQPIAINPDWHDNSDMMGFIDMNGQFRPGEFVSIVRQAASDPGRVYVALLDEMNLAPVEEYFAQYLSMIESRRFDPSEDRVRYSDPCFNRAVRQRLEQIGEDDYKDLRLTDNLLVVGTVNVDESTAPFSKKVLDRANVLLLDQVDLTVGLNAVQSTVLPRAPISVSDFVGQVTNLAELKQMWPRIAGALPVDVTLQAWIDELKSFWQILYRLGAPFGLRVRDEVLIYLAYASQSELVQGLTGAWWHRYFDQQLMQRLLPKVVAEQGVGEPPLLSLFSLCVGREFTTTENALEEDLSVNAAKFPQSASHLQRLLSRLSRDEAPVVGFW